MNKELPLAINQIFGILNEDDTYPHAGFVSRIAEVIIAWPEEWEIVEKVRQEYMKAGPVNRCCFRAW